MDERLKTTVPNARDTLMYAFDSIEITTSAGFGVPKVAGYCYFIQLSRRYILSIYVE